MANTKSGVNVPAMSEMEYGNDYLGWKKWSSDEFGRLTKNDVAYFDAEVKRIRRDIPSNYKVLEIGFGSGAFLTFATNKRWQIIGIEANEFLVRAAKERGYSAFHGTDVSVFDDEAFDLVVAFDVLEHIRQDELEGFLRGVKRILKNNGHFIARVPNGDSPFGLPYQNGDITHVTALGSGKIEFLAKKVGMSLVFLGGQAQPIRGTRIPNVPHRIVAVSLKRLINFVVRVTIFGHQKIEFCSPNLISIFKVNK